MNFNIGNFEVEISAKRRGDPRATREATCSFLESLIGLYYQSSELNIMKYKYQKQVNPEKDLKYLQIASEAAVTTASQIGAQLLAKKLWK